MSVITLGHPYKPKWGGELNAKNRFYGTDGSVNWMLSVKVT